MRNAGVTAGPVYNTADAVADPHFQQRAVPVHNIVPRLSATPGVWRRQAPALGQHTDELLAAVGYGAGEIAAMRGEGAAA